MKLIKKKIKMRKMKQQNSIASLDSPLGTKKQYE